MAMNFNWGDIGRGAGGVAGGLLGLSGIGQKNPADAANNYLNQIPGQTNQYYDPYFQAGKNQLGGLQEQYQQGMNDPSGKYNQIGEGFKQSPGFKFAMEQALGAKDRLNNAGGMGGTPMNTQQDMQLANDLASQDYYKFMEGATGLYGNAMTGAQGMANQGQQAGNNQANMVAQMLAQQGQNAYTGAKEANQTKGGAFSDILSGAGGILGGIFGGPDGAAGGGYAGKKAGSWFGGQ